MIGIKTRKDLLILIKILVYIKKDNIKEIFLNFSKDGRKGVLKVDKDIKVQVEVNIATKNTLFLILEVNPNLRMIV